MHLATWQGGDRNEPHLAATATRLLFTLTPVSTALVAARKEAVVRWIWIEDRSRRPCCVSMWTNLGDFADTAQCVYRRDVWAMPRDYVGVRLEKDALSGIFEDVLAEYGPCGGAIGRDVQPWARRPL